jgi:uncharacterized protein (TIGR00255 family)
MTAYGRAQCLTPSGRWVVEVHSVNRKMLDVHVHLPKELLSLDLEVRKWIGEAVHRGLVTVRVFLEADRVAASVKTLKHLKKSWEGIAKALGYDPKVAVDLPFLLEKLEAEAPLVDEKPLKGDLEKAVQAALKPYVQMKVVEGQALAKDISRRLKTIRTELKKVEKIAPQLKERYAEKLRERLSAFGEVEERVLREIVLYAEKVDGSEEITRLYSHMEQIEEMLNEKKESVGRALDFLMQEMGREIGTLTAKSGDHEISRLAVVIKSEIEKIREQVQNVE